MLAIATVRVSVEIEAEFQDGATDATRRTGSVIDETARSLIKGLLREGRLEKDGDCIRRV